MPKQVQLLQDQATGEGRASESTPMPTLSKMGVILACTGDQRHSFSLLIRRRVQGELKMSSGDSNISFKHSSTEGSSTDVSILITNRELECEACFCSIPPSHLYLLGLFVSLPELSYSCPSIDRLGGLFIGYSLWMYGSFLRDISFK